MNIFINIKHFHNRQKTVKNASYWSFCFSTLKGKTIDYVETKVP